MKPAVHFFEAIRKQTGLKAHHVETIFAAAILSLTALISGKGWIEWIGVVGVTMTFEYQVLSTYLREHAEAKKRKGRSDGNANLVREIQVLYYLKELVWIAYFMFLGAYSALVGTILFICYGIWRRQYRKYFPIDNEIV